MESMTTAPPLTPPNTSVWSVRLSCGETVLRSGSIEEVSCADESGCLPVDIRPLTAPLSSVPWCKDGELRVS